MSNVQRSSRGVVATIAGAVVLLTSLAAPARASSAPAGALVAAPGIREDQPDVVHRYVYYATGEGRFAVAAPDLSRRDSGLKIFDVDPTKPRVLGRPRSVSLAGWDYSGFYSAPGGDFYVLFGRANPGEDDSRDVVAVRRYDRSWRLLGTAYVKGGASQEFKGIFLPFDGASPRMALVGRRLVVHMSRLLYAIDGVHHQSDFTFEVNVDTMKATPFAELGGAPYASHSFAQFVAVNRGDLVFIDQGDAYPRGIEMSVMRGYPAERDVTAYDLFDFNGALGDNDTGASVDGLVSGPSGVVVLGTSVPQPDSPNGPFHPRESRNVYAIAADPSTGRGAVRWVTRFAPDGPDNAQAPRAVQLAPDRFAVIFSVLRRGAYRLEYRLIDSAGQMLAHATFPRVEIESPSDPLLFKGKLYWLSRTSQNASVYLYGLDVNDPAKPSLLMVKRPLVRSAVSRHGRRVAVVVRTAKHARGSIRVTARHGRRHVTLARVGSRYTFTASRPGRWTITIRFAGRSGWRSETVIRRVRV